MIWKLLFKVIYYNYDLFNNFLLTFFFKFKIDLTKKFNIEKNYFFSFIFTFIKKIMNYEKF